MASLHHPRIKAVLSLFLAIWLAWTNAISNATTHPLEKVTNSSIFRTSLPTAQSGLAPPINVTNSSIFRTSLITAQNKTAIQTRRCQMDCSFNFAQTVWPWRFNSTVSTTATVFPVVTVYNDGLEVTNSYTVVSPITRSLLSNHYEGPFPSSVVNGISFTYPTGLVALNSLVDPASPPSCSSEPNDAQGSRSLPNVHELYYHNANLTYAGDTEPTPTKPPASVLRYLDVIPSIAAIFCGNEIACCTASTAPKTSAFVASSTLTQLTAFTAPHVSILAAKVEITKASLGQGFVPHSASLSALNAINVEASLGRGPVPQSTIVPAAEVEITEASLGQGVASQSTPPVSAPNLEISAPSLGQGFVPQRTMSISNVIVGNKDASQTVSAAGAVVGGKEDNPGSEDAHDEDQNGNSQVSDDVPDPARGNATPDTLHSPAQADFQSQNPAQPGLTRFASLPAITPAMAEQISGPSILVLGGQTLTPGGVVKIDDTLVSLPTGGFEVVANGDSIAIGPSPTAITIGSKLIPIIALAATPFPSSSPEALTLDGQKLTPGGVITVDSTLVSLLSTGSALVVNGKTILLGSTPTSVTIGSQIFPIIPHFPPSTALDFVPNALTLDGQTLEPGSVITIDHTPISLPPTGSALIINGKTVAIGPTPISITIGSQVFPITPALLPPTASDFTPYALTLDGQTLYPGSVITIDNTLIYLSPTGSVLIVNGKTVAIGPTPTSITIGSQVIQITPAPLPPTALDFDALTLDGQTLKPGSVITIDNTPISLPTTGSALVIDGKTVPIGLEPTGITIGSQIVSITPNNLGPIPTNFVLNGQTLQPGGNALTISSGVEISLPASGTDVVLISGTSTIREALGPAILSALGIEPTGTAGGQTSPDGALAFTGGGGRVVETGYQALWICETLAMLGFMFGLWWL